MKLHDWFYQYFGICKRDDGLKRVVVENCYSIKFPTPREHNKELSTSIYPNARFRRRSFELTHYCLAYPDVGSGLSGSTIVKDAKYNDVCDCYLNPEVSEWLMGFPIGWTNL